MQYDSSPADLEGYLRLFKANIRIKGRALLAGHQYPQAPARQGDAKNIPGFVRIR